MKLFLAALATACLLAAENPFEVRSDFTPQGRIDELAAAGWAKAGVSPAYLASDAVFLRRVYVDLLGTLPTAAEAAEFLASTAPGKRQALIDTLLARPEFADYQAMKWSDLLRVKAEFPIKLWPNAAQAYHHWIWESIRAGKPYDQFARELLTSSGSNFRDPPVNFFRAVESRTPESLARAVALTFLGQRAELPHSAEFFRDVTSKSTGEWKEEILTSRASQARTLQLPDGSPVKIAAGDDPREPFARWLTSPANRQFAQAVANRVWYWLMGRGIVEEPDDLRPSNPPVNPELLAYLGDEVVAGHYDLKHLFRLILNSRVYQSSAIPRGKPEDSAKNFASYSIRRMDAEVLVDALCQITGTTERYSSAIPEPYTVMPDSQRAIALPDGSTTSAFLELFGRPPRDTGLESERNTKPSADQRLHMLNSSHVIRKIEQGPAITALISGKSPKDVVNQVYLTVLSRYPTAEELQAITKHGQSVKGRAAVNDLIWALLNSPEFLYRH